MGYEDYDDDDAGGRPLWGRIGLLLLGLLLIFFLGRCTAGGASNAELEEARAEVTRLSEENAELRTSIESTASARGGAPSPGPSPVATDGASEDEPSSGGMQTYEVQPNDTLGEIAAEFCGDSEQFPVIEEANDLGGQPLQVGQELEIPAECDQGSSDESTEDATEESSEDTATEESSEDAG